MKWERTERVYFNLAVYLSLYVLLLLLNTMTHTIERLNNWKVVITTT